MAITRTKTSIDLWETEVNRILNEGIRTVPDGQNTGKLLYIVHPGNSPVEGDPLEVAKDGINEYVICAEKQKDRAILVYPPNDEGVYIDPQIVTDIRTGYDESAWVHYDDLDGVKNITLVGGGLRKCLGITYENIVSLLMHTAENSEMENPELNVVLPLESIYTEGGCTAEEELLAGSSVMGRIESLISLLYGINPKNPEYTSEYGFIHPRINQRINVFLNDEQVLSLDGECIKPPPEPKPDSIPCCLPPLYRTPTTVNLHVFYDDETNYNGTGNKTYDDYLESYSKYRWNSIREINPGICASFND